MSSNILKIPFGKNMKLKTLMRNTSENKKLQSFWKCANVMAIDRMGYADHGPIHVKIVANSALKILRILLKNDIVPSVVSNYNLSNDDAEVIVVLASILHDIGMSVTRDDHGEFSVLLSLSFINELLEGLYDEAEKVILCSEILHSLVTHHHTKRPLTLEAGIVRLADALDMEEGRARIPFEAGKINIHSVSASSIEKVQIKKGEQKPISIMIRMSSSAGIFQIDQLLRNKIRNSNLEEYVHVVAEVTGKREAKIFERFEF